MTDEYAAKAEYLEELPDGCGCVEVWEHLSEIHERPVSD